MRRLWVPFAMAVLLVAVLAATGCSASVSTGSSSPTPASSSGSTAATKTYSNTQYSFRITYPASFKQGNPSGASSAGSSAAFEVIFADPKGAQVNNLYVDTVGVSVYQLKRSVSAAEVPKLKQQFDQLVSQLMSGFPGAKITQPLGPTVINGVPGFKFGYSYAKGSTQIQAVTYFLLKRSYEYELTEQASQQNWATVSPQLDAAVKSFTVL